MPLIELENQRKRSRVSPLATEVARTIQPPKIVNAGKPGAKVVTFDELEVDEEFQRHGKKVKEYLQTNDDIFETMRDFDWNMARGLNMAYQSGKMPDDVKESYAYVRRSMDNADLGSMEQWGKAAVDIGIDVLSDPTNVVPAIVALFTGGGSVAGKAVAQQGVRAALRKVSASNLAATEGVAWGGLASYNDEKIRESVGLNDGVSGMRVATSAAVGGVAGKLLGRFFSKESLEKTEKAFSPTTYNEKNEIGPLEQFWSNTVSLIGKPTGILDPAAKISSRAAELQSKLRFDANRQVNWNGYSPKERAVSKADYNETVQQIAGRDTIAYKDAVAPLLFNGRRMPVDTQQALAKALRMGPARARDAGIDEPVVEAAIKVRGILDRVGRDMMDKGLIGRGEADTFIFNGSGINQYVKLPVANYVPRRWKRDVIQRHQGEFQKLLLESGQVKDMESAQKLTASLLDIKNQIDKPGGDLFSANRVLLDIDDATFGKFLDGNFDEIMHDYIRHASVKRGTMDVFGVKSQDEFNEKWILPIAEDYAKKGMELPQEMRDSLMNLYRYTTGDGLEYLSPRMQALKDGTSMINKLALLPMSTLASLSEIVLPLTRTRPDIYFKGIMQGIGAGTKLLGKEILDTLKVKHSMSEPQAFRELKEMGVIVEEVAGDSFERLSGDAAKNRGMRKVEQFFFKANGLTPWTRFMQGVTYATGKLETMNSIKYVAKAGNLDNMAGVEHKNILADLGVDWNEAKKWYNEGADETAPFFEKVKEAGARYSESFILNPNRQANIVPTYMKSPKYDILYQFMSYPTAFNNVILKNALINAVENPVRGGTGLIASAIMLTQLSRVLNYYRSDGRSEENVEDWEANYNAIRRFGGNGMFLDTLQRAHDTAKTFDNPLMGAVGLFGPIVSDAASMATFRKGPAELLLGKTPGYVLGFSTWAKPLGLGREGMEDLKKKARKVDKNIKDTLLGTGKEESISSRGY